MDRRGLLADRFLASVCGREHFTREGLSSRVGSGFQPATRRLLPSCRNGARLPRLLRGRVGLRESCLSSRSFAIGLVLAPVGPRKVQAR